MKSLNYLMVHILHQVFNIIYIIKQHEAVSDNLPMRIYVNQIENRIKLNAINDEITWKH